MDWDSRREHSETSSGLRSLVQGLVEIWFGWATNGFQGAWPPFFVIPSFAFILAFWVVLLRFFGQSLVRWSGLPHPKQIWIFPLIQLDHCGGKTNNIPYWLYPLLKLHLRFLHPLQLKTWPLLPLLTLYLSLSSASLLSTIADCVVKVWLPFNCKGGKQIPWGLRTSNVWSSSCSGLWEERISGFCLSFQLLGC